MKDLRAIMTWGDVSDQHEAAKLLIKKNDLKTILRLIYSLKQGNPRAEVILRGSNSLFMVPYLLEDVAHGSLQYYGDKYPRSDTGIVGTVRTVATEVVSEVLANSSEFTGATRDCLRSIYTGRGYHALPDESRYLIQWWLLNESALNAEEWDKVKPLPQEIIYIQPEMGEAPAPSAAPPPDPIRNTPKFGPSWELSESFEAWSKRIVQPKLRNLDFVELTWHHGGLIEHPAKSLDPKAPAITRQDRESRKTPAQRNPQESESRDGGRRISWIVVAAILLVALSIIRWMMRKPTAKI